MMDRLSESCFRFQMGSVFTVSMGNFDLLLMLAPSVSCGSGRWRAEM